jgi:predicted nucleic acid-binding protein
LIVVDASVLTDFLLGRAAAIDAVMGEMSAHEHEPVHAPELIEPEVLNALRRMALAERVSDERAGEAAADLAGVRMLRHPHAPLRARVWELRHALTAYDATYLALAEALPGALLLTGDRGLAGAARGCVGAERVHHVA